MNRTYQRWARAAVILVVIALATSGVAVASAASPKASDWPMFGQNLNNTASAPATKISAHNIVALKPKWAFTTSGDVSARAAVVGNVAYVPDWGGHLYAINADTGELIWSTSIATDYLDGAYGPKVVSRTSPFVDAGSNTLYLGTQAGAFLLAINTTDGSLRWATQLDSHPLAIATNSPIVYQGIAYVGVASLEEAASANPGYPCCSFRGSVVAVNASTGQVDWKTYMAPEGYTGSSVWGSTLVPDPQHGLLFATTGNNYSTPTDPAYAACIANGGVEEACLAADDYFDSVVALNMATGSIVWTQRLASADDWNVACFVAPFTNCPTGSGPDYDFGSGANLFTVQTASGPRTILGAGQKSGIYSAFDPATGQLLWATEVGPGSSLGGIEWGSATDGQRIYVASGNYFGLPSPAGNAGSWAALDPLTGAIIWQVADPNGASDLGPMAVANGVVYAPSMAGGATTPNMFALDAASGQTVWQFAAGGSVIAGAVIANDTVYWGSGYSNLGIEGFTGNNKFYAFTLGGH